MKRFIYMIMFLFGLFLAQEAYAQPPSRRADQEKQNSGPTLSVRAQTQYTGQVDMPEEVVWKREIYRELNLQDEKNAALYYPVEPMGNRMNLFTYVFKLIAEGKIPAYEYKLDGTEDFSAENRIDFKNFLERFYIYYEERVENNNRDTVLIIENSDIPSAEVLSYYIKEDWYFDHRSSNYNSKVVAICPVMHRNEDFAVDVTKYPMFWLNYKDVAPYLGRMSIMTSNLNNTANLTIDDYFTTRLFKGDIYKTTNMLNLALNQYCPTDSALVQEQQRIEGQLEAFGNNLWESTKGLNVQSADSTALLAQQTTVNSNAIATKAASTPTSNSKRKGRDKAESTSSSTKVKKESSPKSSGSSGGARVSVRRERR